MLMVINDVVQAADLPGLRERILALPYIDGTATAGWHAKLVKKNLQADRNDPGFVPLNKEVTERIARNSTFQLAVRPRSITPLLFSRYHDNMTYGTHVDDAVILGMRSDVSFTLSLTDPTTYDGGELVMETAGGEQAFKLKAGQMIIYPSTTLHRVQPVTRGERLAAVGWTQSQIREANCREILYDLEIARRSLFDKYGKTREFDLLSKTAANLLRQWVEV